MKKVLLLMFLFVSFYYSSFAYTTQGNWRWRNDNGNEKTATWRAAQNKSIVISSIDSVYRLRMQISNTTGSDKNVNSNLQYASAPDGPWHYVTNYAANNAFKITLANSYVKDLTATTQQLTGSSNTFSAGKVFVKTNELDNLLTNNVTSEFEYCIQPTENILPNTTYYFKVPGSDYPVALPSVTTTATINNTAKLLTNGSFENGLTDWNYRLRGSAKASFTLTDSLHKDGLKALYVDVNVKGVPGDVGFGHKEVRLRTGRVYMVRFWARANKSGADLKLVVKGNKMLPYLFKMYTGWMEYQFAFKAESNAATINFLFNTPTEYLLDKIELLDENDDETDVAMNYMWQNNRPENQYAWLSADGENSELLPDGRTVWTFSDGWYGYNDTTTNAMKTSQLLRNTFVEQTTSKPNGVLNTIIGGTVSKPDAIMKPPTDNSYHDNFFWPRDFTLENDSLKILLPQVVQVKANDPLSDGLRQAVGVISLPDLKVRSIQYMPWLTGDTVYFIAMCKADDGYTYAYGSNPTRHTVVARFPTGQLNATTPWQFLTNKGWSFSSKNRKEIADVQLYCVAKLSANNYVSLFLNPLSDKIEVLYAESPIGPWVSRSIVGQLEGQDGVLAYFALLHEGTVKNGTYTYSYSNNGPSISQMLNDKTCYWPSFKKANLKLLSPFNNNASTVATLEFSAAAEKQTVKLDWKTTNDNKAGRFEIERSADGKNDWTLLNTFKTNNSSAKTKNYNTADAQALAGNNYYRLKQLDENGILLASDIRMVNVNKTIVKVYPNPSKADVYFSLENYAGSKVQVKLSNVDGKILLDQAMQVQNGGNYRLPVIKKPVPGVYQLTIVGENLNNTTQVIIR